jgi:hypothetical protein
VLVAYTSMDEHKQYLRTLFHRFSEYDVLLNPAKCVFGATEVTFLGYTVSAECTRPMDEKGATKNPFQRLVLVKELRHFLGVLNFCRRLIPQADSIQATLHAALAVPKIKGSQSADWTTTMVQTFEDCKTTLTRATLLAPRNHLLRWPYLQTLLILLLAPPCSSVSATLGNLWLSTPISSALLNKSKVRTTASFWQCMRPSNTSGIWSKAVPLSSLHITSLSLTLFSNAQINAHYDNSVTWSLLDNSLLNSGMSQGKTLL